ncbi:MAG: mechanosensitive ion channel [Bacteroidetes bacterium]|nr:mechanosensitive ion channel [Bacteroidota bacterium]
MDENWLNQVYFENDVRSYLLFFTIILAGIILKRFVSFHLSGLFYRAIKKRVAGVDVKMLRHLLRKPFGLFVILLSVYLACKQLHYPESWHLPSEEKFGIRLIIWRTFQLSIFISITWIVLRFIDFFGIVLAHRVGIQESQSDNKIIPFMREAIKIIVIILSFFMILGTIFEVNVASLIAGLGIGGIALALAAKESIENLLASFTIFLDKPFSTGDLVKAGSVKGSVEKIGFRSTQIRTLDRTIFSVPNKKMIDSDVENVSQRNMIRASFTALIRFDTPISKLKNSDKKLIPSFKILIMFPTTPPYIHIENFTIQGVEMKFIYFIESIDFTYFSEKREFIFLKILDTAQQEEIKLGIRDIQ